jgi:hypothetical protein
MLHPAEKSARFKLVFKEKWAKSIWFRTGAIAGEGGIGSRTMKCTYGYQKWKGKHFY